MNFTKEKLPVFALENKDVLLIKDAFVLGIYTFMKMEIEQGEYTVVNIVDKMKVHFFLDDKQIMSALKIIIDELELITMVQRKE